MGGVNCPPPLTDRLMPEVKAAYVNSLAQYCDSLFSGTSLFFAANAKIEQAVLVEGNLNEAIELLKLGEDRIEDAKSRIGAVSSLYEQLAPNQSVNFGTQLDALDDAQKKIGDARMELELLSDTDQIQDALWSSPELTENFTAAMDALAATLTWQASFAKSHVLAAIA